MLNTCSTVRGVDPEGVRVKWRAAIADVQWIDLDPNRDFTSTPGHFQLGTKQRYTNRKLFCIGLRDYVLVYPVLQKTNRQGIHISR